MTKITTGFLSHSSKEEDEIRRSFVEHFRKCPIPDDQILANLGLFLNSKTLSRILFMHHIYKLIIDVQGIIIDFGTRWGKNMALFAALRGIYEPFNRHRKIVGFDTFEGFPSISEQDGSSEMMEVGSVIVTENYDQYLQRVIEYQERDNPMAHIRKFDIRVGNAIKELPRYLKHHSETIVALAFFDFDLYEPTKKCLDRIRPHLVKGSILVFDELNDHDSPGETLALMETFGLNNIRLKRYPHASRVSYFVLE